jgi:hypothetical protein
MNGLLGNYLAVIMNGAAVSSDGAAGNISTD